MSQNSAETPHVSTPRVLVALIAEEMASKCSPRRASQHAFAGGLGRVSSLGGFRLALPQRSLETPSSSAKTLGILQLPTHTTTWPIRHTGSGGISCLSRNRPICCGHESTLVVTSASASRRRASESTTASSNCGEASPLILCNASPLKIQSTAPGCSSFVYEKPWNEL